MCFAIGHLEVGEWTTKLSWIIYFQSKNSAVLLFFFAVSRSSECHIDDVSDQGLGGSPSYSGVISVSWCTTTLVTDMSGCCSLASLIARAKACMESKGGTSDTSMQHKNTVNLLWNRLYCHCDALRAQQNSIIVWIKNPAAVIQLILYKYIIFANKVCRMGND